MPWAPSGVCAHALWGTTTLRLCVDLAFQEGAGGDDRSSLKSLVFGPCPGPQPRNV